MPDARPLAGRFAYLVAYLILPNVAFAFAGQFVYLVRATVNLDYLVLGMVAPSLPYGVTLGLYACLLLNDLFVALGAIYHFQPSDLVVTVADLAHLNALTILPVLGLAVVVVGLLATSAALVARQGGRYVSWNRASVVFAAILLFGSDVVNGTSWFSYSGQAIIPLNIATSQVYRMADAAVGVFRGELDRGKAGPRQMAAGATTRWFRPDAGDGAGVPSSARHAVLVIVESFGVFRDPTAHEAILSVFRDPRVTRRYRVMDGTVPFHGATTAAEFRELCGLRLKLNEADRETLSKCLPWRLRAEGFHTVAIHGFTGRFFRRWQWYPWIGFERSLFAEDMREGPSVQYCGTTVRGVCDEDAARLVERELLDPPRGERRFVYWLTLSSHLPTDVETAGRSSFDCRSVGTIHEYPDVCRLTRVIHLALSSVIDVALHPELEATHFLIVGDHSPPFVLDSRRQLFLDDRVPVVELQPYDAGRR